MGIFVPGVRGNESGEVQSKWWKTCGEFVENQATKVAQEKGVAGTASETVIKGTAKIKKNNFSDHVKKRQMHATAVLRLTEVNSNRTSSSAAAEQSEVLRQRTLVPYLQKISARKRFQFTRKF